MNRAFQTAVAQAASSGDLARTGSRAMHLAHRFRRLRPNVIKEKMGNLMVQITKVNASIKHSYIKQKIKMSTLQWYVYLKSIVAM